MGGRVRLALEGAVAVVTNDNPAEHNAFDADMDRQLASVWAEIAGRGDVRAVVWRGNGPSFSAGRSDGAAPGPFALPPALPVVVALHGWVIGEALLRAVLCDVRVAAEDTSVLLPEVGRGEAPAVAGLAGLGRLVGRGVAADLVLTGRRMDAFEAMAHGLVSRVVSADRLDDTAMEAASAIASAPRAAVQSARASLGLGR